jgi:hypothetical protein
LTALLDLGRALADPLDEPGSRPASGRGGGATTLNDTEALVAAPAGSVTVKVIVYEPAVV